MNRKILPRFCYSLLWVVITPPLMADEPISQKLSQQIDKRLAQGWGEISTKPVAPASDEEFVRRVYLDVIGRIPTANETSNFINDVRANKRALLIDLLLKNPGFRQQSAQLLRAFLIPQASSNPRLQYLAVSFETWLREEMNQGKKFDAITRDLLSAPLHYQDRATDGPSKPATTVSPLGYYQASDLKTETLASSVARQFMGIRIECAQCHDHPFDRWTRTQFWETAAFFIDVPPIDETVAAKTDAMMTAGIPKLKIPELNQTATAKLLDGKPVNWNSKNKPRNEFANWMTSPENPYFAKMAVNRIWAHYFGVGIVDPIDDFGIHNPPSHPELLDELAKAYIASGFDDTVIVQAITNTAAYQRSSKSESLTQADPRLYLKMNIKALSPEQLFDNLAQAGGYRQTTPLAAQAAYGWDANSPRGQLVAKFGGGTNRSDMQTSILQALFLMNGSWLAELTDPTKSNTLIGLLESPFLDDGQRIDQLYLGTVNRKPNATEKARVLKLLENAKNRPQSFGDIFGCYSTVMNFWSTSKVKTNHPRNDHGTHTNIVTS